MDKYGITHISAKHLTCQHQIEKYMKEKQVSYGMTCIAEKYMKEKQVSYGMTCIADDAMNNYNICPL